MRTLLFASLLVLAAVLPAFGETIVREISWKALRETQEAPMGELVEGKKPGPIDVLKVENEGREPGTINVFRLDHPGITSFRYAVTGQVRYESVEETGYLEMWSAFGDKGEYFSRTLGEWGPMRSLQGSSDWRPFSLPFLANEQHGLPTRLVVNVVLPGKGTVYMGPLRVVQYEQNEDPLAIPGEWWGERTSGLIGGITGGVVGCLGGLIGVLAGLGRSRNFVLTLAKALLCFGVLSLLVGLVALGLGQPYAVWYPLLLLGVILTAVIGANLRTLRRRYEELELRRMAAMDVAAGSRSG